jgi:hypothetical protein
VTGREAEPVEDSRFLPHPRVHLAGALARGALFQDFVNQQGGCRGDQHVRARLPAGCAAEQWQHQHQAVPESSVTQAADGAEQQLHRAMDADTVELDTKVEVPLMQSVHCHWPLICSLSS